MSRQLPTEPTNDRNPLASLSEQQRAELAARETNEIRLRISKLRYILGQADALYIDALATSQKLAALHPFSTAGDSGSWSMDLLTARALDAYQTEARVARRELEVLLAELARRGESDDDGRSDGPATLILPVA